MGILVINKSIACIRETVAFVHEPVRMHNLLSDSVSKIHVLHVLLRRERLITKFSTCRLA